MLKVEFLKKLQKHKQQEMILSLFLKILSRCERQALPAMVRCSELVLCSYFIIEFLTEWEL